MLVDEVRSAWVSGQLVPWKDVNQAAHIAEGIRCYATPDGPAVFRLDEHIEHFFQSAALHGIRIPFTPRELKAAVCQIVAANGLSDCYVRPAAFANGRVETTVAVWPWPSRDAPAGEPLLAMRDGVVTCADASHPVADAILTIANDLGCRGEDESLVVDGTGVIRPEKNGPFVDLIQQTFTAATNGTLPRYRPWLHFVDDCMLAGAYNAAACI